jgi:ubiquinol-cytochrome c reductase cytochrome b subunit
MLGHPLNYIQANPGVTPVHIVPEWYFLPFYGILRAIPSKIFGVLLMLSSLLLLSALPAFHDVDVKHSTYRPIYKFLVFFFFFNFLMLGWVGYHVLEDPFIVLSRVFCFFYIFFFVALVFISVIEKLLGRDVNVGFYMDSLVQYFKSIYTHTNTKINP